MRSELNYLIKRGANPLDYIDCLFAFALSWLYFHYIIHLYFMPDTGSSISLCRLLHILRKTSFEEKTLQFSFLKRLTAPRLLACELPM
jgi:hypothetical protein